MTEAWKSTPHHFCELCKVWMNDNPQARAVHEQGMKHQENLSRKLRDMRMKADAEKRNEALAKASMSQIEAKAQRQYAQDMKASSEARQDLTGTWDKDAESGYLYNARHRFYYDSGTKMYYGGEPPAWTVTPALPPEALYKPSVEKATPPSTTGNSAATKSSVLRPGMKATNAHPMAKLGGRQMPTVGKIGGAGNFVTSHSAQAGRNGAQKRGREEAPGGKAKALSKEEEEALKRREAARARVQQREMKTYGLG